MKNMVKRFNITVLMLIIATSLLTTFAHSHEHSNDEQTFEKLRAFVNKQMAEQAVPGVAIGVYHKGKFSTANFGITNVDNPQRVTDDTLFQIGSITKTMTGTIMMRLVEQGKLDLDAPVRQYLPSFKVKNEEVSANVKVRHLLTHMSGWVGDYFSDTGNGDNALDLIVAEMSELEQLAPMNTVYSYNNSAFYVAALIIEQVTDDTLTNVMESMIFNDLGLKNSFIKPTDVMTKSYVVGHRVSGDGLSVATPWALYKGAWAVGGGIMTARDMLKYAAFHLGDGANNNGKQILKKSSLQAMQALQGKKNGVDGIGITWHLSQVGMERTLSHGGSTNGQQAYLLMLPERDFAITILTNASSRYALHNKVNAFALEQYFDLKNAPPIPQTLSQGDLTEYEGHYSRPFIDMKITASEGRLLMQEVPKQAFLGNKIAPAPPPVVFNFFEKDRVVSEDGNSKADFIRLEDGSIGWFRNSRISVKQ
jgi:CubicO group peptidase (beta-lactamase class C family)